MATGFGMALTVLPVAALVAGVWFYVVRWLMGRPSVLCEAGIVLLPVVAAVQGAKAGEVAAMGSCAGLILVRLWTGRERPDEASLRPATQSAEAGGTPNGS